MAIWNKANILILLQGTENFHIHKKNPFYEQINTPHHNHFTSFLDSDKNLVNVSK